MKPRRRRCSARSARIPRRPWRKPPSSRSKSNRGAPRLAVLLTKKSRVLVQGITGHQGQFHTRAMIDFGTKVVAGVTPGKIGTKVEGVPVFDSVREAVHRRRATASIIFVPAPYAKDAAIEAIEGGLKLVVIITERIPFHDCLDVMPCARSRGCQQTTGHETGRGIRRRTHGAARKADGPCGGDYPGKPRNGRVEGQGIRGGGSAGRGISGRHSEAPRSHVTDRPPRNLQISACAPSPGEPRRAESLPREGETLGT